MQKTEAGKAPTRIESADTTALKIGNVLSYCPYRGDVVKFVPTHYTG